MAKILVVDDAATDRMNLEKILSEAGHLITTAQSGKEAIEKAKSDKPVLIFMDVNMAEMDGFAATRALQADAATKGIPIVFVTSKDQKADKMWGQMLGAKAYVTKPYTKEQILEQVKGL
jgi:twitching motility two-component system response regulator PilH